MAETEVDEAEGAEEHQEEVVEEVEVSCLPSTQKLNILHCNLQCVLLGHVGRFGGIANSSQGDLATEEVEAAHEVADEAVVRQGVEERQGEDVVEPEEVQRP